MGCFLMIYGGLMDHYSRVLLNIGVHIILLASLGRTSTMRYNSPWHMMYYVFDMENRVIHSHKVTIMMYHIVIFLHYDVFRITKESLGKSVPPSL